MTIESNDRKALRVALDALRNLRMFTEHDMSRNDAAGAVDALKAALAQPDPVVELADLLIKAYRVLAAIDCQWPGRHSEAGQQFLAETRDALAAHYRIEQRELQDLCSAPLAKVGARPSNLAIGRRTALQNLGAVKGRDSVLSLLGEHGAQTLPTLKPEKYAAVVAKAAALVMNTAPAS